MVAKPAAKVPNAVISVVAVIRFHHSRREGASGRDSSPPRTKMPVTRKNTSSDAPSHVPDKRAARIL